MTKLLPLLFFVGLEAWSASFLKMANEPNENEHGPALSSSTMTIKFYYPQLDFDYHESIKFEYPRENIRPAMQNFNFTVDDIDKIPKAVLRRMAQLSHLSSLEIKVSSKDGWSAGIGNHLVKLLSKITLTELYINLNSSKLLMEDMRLVAGAISMQQKLRQLRLSFHGCGLVGDDAKEIIKAAALLSRLTQLRIDFSNNNIDDESTDIIIQHLLTMKDLTSLKLNLEKNLLTPPMQRSIRGRLEVLPKLGRLQVITIDSDLWNYRGRAILFPMKSVQLAE